MWKPKTLTIALAIAWIAGKLIFYFTGISITRFSDSVALNFGCMLFVVYNALQYYYKSATGHSAFLDDFKIALREALRYVVIVFLFLLGYYFFVEKTVKEDLAEHWKVSQVEDMGGYDSYLNEIIKINAVQGGEPISREDYPETLEEHVSEFKLDVQEQVSNGAFASVILLGLFFLAGSLSAIGAAVFKFFIRNAK